MKVLKALFLLFLVLLFLMAAIPTGDAGANNKQGPVPTPKGDGATVLFIHAAYSNWERVEPNGYDFLKNSGSQRSETRFMA